MITRYLRKINEKNKIASNENCLKKKMFYLINYFFEHNQQKRSRAFRRFDVGSASRPVANSVKWARQGRVSGCNGERKIFIESV